MSKARVHTGSIKWLETSGSGYRIGMLRTITKSRQTEIRKDPNRDNSKCYAVDLGPTSRSICSPMGALSCLRIRAIVIRASAARNHNRLLEEAFADFCRKRAFVAGIVIGGHGEEIGLAFRKIKEGVARDFSCHEG